MSAPSKQTSKSKQQQVKQQASQASAASAGEFKIARAAPMAPAAVKAPVVPVVLTPNEAETKLRRLCLSLAKEAASTFVPLVQIGSRISTQPKQCGRLVLNIMCSDFEIKPPRVKALVEIAVDRGLMEMREKHQDAKGNKWHEAMLTRRGLEVAQLPPAVAAKAK